MKKLLAMLALASFMATSCHYGEEEAKKTLETNDKYKSDKAEFSVNRAEPSGTASTGETSSSAVEAQQKEELKAGETSGRSTDMDTVAKDAGHNTQKFK